MRRSVVVASILVLAGCGGFRDMFTAHTDAVAVVDGRDLTADRVSELFVGSQGLAVQSEVMTRFSHLWVNYMLFADRILAGDSLIDSAAVLAANWPSVHQILISRFHDQVVGERTTLDSAGVDSAYGAGEYRLIRHILIRADTGLSASQIDAKRRQAERLRVQAAAGGWERANQSSEDPNAKAQNGTVGVIGRGETVEPFDVAAFALGPGELGPVTETPFGFHVIRRPALGEVRQQFREGVEQRLVARLDSTFLAELPRRLNLKVRSGAAASVREVARDPMGSRQSRRVLASFDGGRFTAGDLARWFDLLPPQAAQQIPTATDDDLRNFVQALARNAMLLAETHTAGVELTSEEFGRLRGDLAMQVLELKTALRLDSLSAEDTAASRKELAAARVNAYLSRIAEEPQALVPVPGPLADYLREHASWRVYAAGVQRAFDLARTQRAALDSAAGRVAPEGRR